MEGFLRVEELVEQLKREGIDVSVKQFIRTLRYWASLKIIPAPYKMQGYVGYYPTSIIPIIRHLTKLWNDGAKASQLKKTLKDYEEIKELRRKVMPLTKNEKGVKTKGNELTPEEEEKLTFTLLAMQLLRQGLPPDAPVESFRISRESGDWEVSEVKLRETK